MNNSIKSADPKKSIPGLIEMDRLEIMKKYGISLQMTEYFHLGEYRYTNLEDAVAQARRLADLRSTS